MLGERKKKKHSNFTRESLLKGEQWLTALPIKTYLQLTANLPLISPEPPQSWEGQAALKSDGFALQKYKLKSISNGSYFYKKNLRRKVKFFYSFSKDPIRSHVCFE